MAGGAASDAEARVLRGRGRDPARGLAAVLGYRGPRRRHVVGGVSIEILHPGDAVGEGLIRHCTFRVPRYLMTGGVGPSWEWLTEVVPPVSWTYDAVGKPLYSIAEGRTRLRGTLGDGRTRIHFSETYHAFNPVMRVLLERRVHRFISKDNDRLITTAINDGIASASALRRARGRAPIRASGCRGGCRGRGRACGRCRGRRHGGIVTPRNLSGTWRLL